MIKVSVIIPVYNTEKYIAECLDSVIAQDLREWEIICINDASTDGSAEIMRKYAEQDSRIRIITLQKNGGQAAGRNLGLREAQGEYVYFLDSDDMLQIGALQQMCSSMERYQVDGMVFNAKDFYETLELADEAPVFPGVSSAMEEKGVMDGESMFLAMREEGHPCCQPGRFLWKRSYLLDKSIWNDEETSPHEDELFFLRAVLSAKQLIAVAKEFHLRRYRADSVMTGHTIAHDLRHCKSYLLLWLRSAEFFRAHNFANQRCREAALNYAGMFLKGGLDYARRLSPEQRAQLKFNNPLDAKLLRDVLSESITDRKAEVFLRRSDLQQILYKERVFLYGAGVCGQKVLRLLLQCGCPRETLSFVVTDKQGKTNLDGFPISDLESIQDFDSQKDVFIVAVTQRWRKEVAGLLDKRHFPYVLPEEGYAVMPAPNDDKNATSKIWNDLLEKYYKEGAEENVYVIGDSHVTFFSSSEWNHFVYQDGIGICRPRINPFRVFHLGPALAYNLNKYGTTTKAREKIDYLLGLNVIPKGGKILCVFGEIDIRVHVFKQAKKREVDFKIVVDEILDEYALFIENLSKNYKVYLWCPVASQSDDCPLDINFPRFGSQIERNKATAYFAEKLQNRCSNFPNTKCLSIFSSLIDENGRTKLQFYKDQVHLAQQAWTFAADEFKKNKIIYEII